MGLFGSLKKIAGKVLKSGLSVATRGVSDKALSIFKSLGRKTTAMPKQLTQQQEAQLNKIAPRANVSTVYENARAGGGQYGAYKSKTTYKRKRARAMSQRAPARKPPKAKRAKSATRKAPSGGLDLKRMALAWRAAGKPMSWRDWIKTNQLRKA